MHSRIFLAQREVLVRVCPQEIVNQVLINTLAECTGICSKKIEIHRTPLGKPFLAPAQNQAQWSFSLSHSYDVGVLAFAQGCQIGIDLERIRPVEHLAKLGQRFFGHPVEHDQFFERWVALEAKAKAAGVGLWRAKTLRTEEFICEPLQVPGLPKNYIGAVALFSVTTQP